MSEMTIAMSGSTLVGSESWVPPPSIHRKAVCFVITCGMQICTQCVQMYALESAGVSQDCEVKFMLKHV